jgi:hypothetical protein
MTLRVLRRAAMALAAFLCMAAVPASSLEGRWKLVEQRYGSGELNLASIEAPARLEFFVSGGRLAARIWAGEDRSSALPWPALLTEHGAHPLEIRQLSIDPASNQARAVYRPRPATPNAEVVEIIEEYRLAEGGGALLGTVTVSSLGPGGPAGSYVLKRRFVREP